MYDMRQQLTELTYC